MKINELLREHKTQLNEGGWDSASTEEVAVTSMPGIMRVVERFINDFNSYAKDKSWPEIAIGRPTGSASHWQQDLREKPDTKYGDVDLQIVVPVLDEYRKEPYTQLQKYWVSKWLEFIQEELPEYLNIKETLKLDSKGRSGFNGHLTLNAGTTSHPEYKQVDLMPHANSKWGIARVTPERGVKGLLHGNMFSVLGELLNYSIQHAGVQYKERDQARLPYTLTRSNYVLRTLTDDPDNFIMDIFNHERRMQKLTVTPHVDALLVSNPGVPASVQDDPSTANIASLARGIKGLAKSFEANKMFGQGHLVNYQNADEFLRAFWQLYEKKATSDINSSKREKGDPERAERDREKIRKGLSYVKKTWNAVV